MKLNSKIHGIIDYLMVAFLWLSPTLFELGHTTTTVAYGLGVIFLCLSILTNYDYALVRFIPLKIHGSIEIAISIVALAAAFLLRSVEGEVSRNFLIGIAIAVFLLWIVSDYHNKLNSTDEIYVESNTDGGMI